MKELSIEEKAKRYDDRLEKARKWYNANTNEGYKGIFEDIFPELKESEDERIRKELLAWLKSRDGQTLPIDRYNAAVAWLEKQGEQKSLDDIVKEVTKDKDAAISFFKSTGIINENGELADEYKIEQDEQKSEEVDNLHNYLYGDWSEDDELTRKAIINLVEMYYGGCIDKTEKNRLLNFLKYFRPQNWTKEDKERYISCLQRLSTGNPEQPETINSKWFKEHVCPQSTWKPSDEQMDALHDAAVYVDKSMFPYPKGILMKLYKQLKKLREE